MIDRKKIRLSYSLQRRGKKTRVNLCTFLPKSIRAVALQKLGHRLVLPQALTRAAISVEEVARVRNGWLRSSAAVALCSGFFTKQRERKSRSRGETWRERDKSMKLNTKLHCSFYIERFVPLGRQLYRGVAFALNSEIPSLLVYKLEIGPGTIMNV